MILTRSTSLVTVSVLCLVAMPAAGAMGATKKKKVKAPARPTVSSVAPLSLGVGDMLTIRGKNFVVGKKKDTVMFKSDGNPSVAVKAVDSSTTSMKVVVPSALAKYFVSIAGVPQPTTFRLRILAKKFGLNFTSPALSPLIGPANVPGATDTKTPVAPVSALAPAPAVIAAPPLDTDGDGIPDSVDPDDDNDLLSDSLEATLKTDPLSADTDRDGVEDGYEWQSAVDLNNTIHDPLPYPGKRPYPNPLDGSDGGTDYDGDGLSMVQEHLMWKAYGPHSLALSYSAGLKKSTAPFDPVSCPSVPNAGCNDDFRDVDNDGLSNWDEFDGRMVPEWWAAVYTEVPYTESYAGTSAIDPDSDGDGRLDGADDNDHDLWTNAEEISRDIPSTNGSVSPARHFVQPFNPCLPDYNSPTCSSHPPVSGSYPPFDLPSLPASPIIWPLT